METIEYKGFTIEIGIDEFPEDPRENDNLGNMYCLHKRYDLGDKHSFTLEDLRRMPTKADVISLPLYLYDHSGITISTKPYSCPWDSGQVGIIMVSHDEIKKEFSRTRLSTDLIKQVKRTLAFEVKEYDLFIQGQIYYFKVFDTKGNEVESCYNFFGEKGCTEEAKAAVDYIVSQKEEKDGQQSDRMEHYISAVETVTTR